MKSVISVKSFLSFLLTLSGFALGYTWPVGYDPAHPQPQVSSPYGEFRKKYYTLPDNFHSGTDIPGREGAEIYALDNGQARENNDIYCWGKVISLIDSENKHWLYLHLKDLQINPNGQDIIEGQLLAKTIGPPPPYGWEAGYDDHLHLTLNNPATTEMAPIGNPLDYLPFNDPGNKSPFIWHLTNAFAKRLAFKETNNKYTKWAYAPAAGEEPPVLWGNVDIIVKAQDDMDGTLANGDPVYTGVYEAGFWITDMEGNAILGSANEPKIMYTFDSELPPDGEIFYFFSENDPASETHDFYYLVTNIGGNPDSCWSTKADEGSSGTGKGDTAWINNEARFKDGKCKVRIHAMDVSNKTAGLNWATVKLDNFKPYARFVQIGQEEKVVKYEAHWSDPIDNYHLDILYKDVDDYCTAGKLLTFLIEFSEDMKTDALPTLQVQFPDGTIKTVPGGLWVGSDVYRAVTGYNFIVTGVSGRATLMISGAYDLAGNQNDGNPRTIAYRDAGGDWQQAESIADNNYKFWIDPPPHVDATDPEDGVENVDIYKKITIVFNKTMDTTSMRGALDIKNSDEGNIVTIKEIEWQDDDKTMLITAYDPVVLDDTIGFDFYTNYQVLITGYAADTSGATLDGRKA